MKRISIAAFATMALCAIASISLAPTSAKEEASPIYGVTIPDGYRQWQVVAPSQKAGNLNELRVIIGNSVAMRAYRQGKLPFPDGTILVKIA